MNHENDVQFVFFKAWAYNDIEGTEKDPSSIVISAITFPVRFSSGWPAIFLNSKLKFNISVMKQLIVRTWSIQSCIILFQSSPVTIRKSVITALNPVSKFAWRLSISPYFTLPKRKTPQNLWFKSIYLIDYKGKLIWQRKFERTLKAGKKLF